MTQKTLLAVEGKRAQERLHRISDIELRLERTEGRHHQTRMERVFQAKKEADRNNGNWKQIQ